MKVKVTGPVRGHCPPADPPFANMNRLGWTKDLGPEELALHFPLGKQVYFTQPLQRRASYIGGEGDRFWWEPSGGKNNALFSGIITGIRMHSTGHSDECRAYVPDSQFPVLLVAYSIYKNPVPVMPWLTFETPEVYEYWRRQAEKNQDKIDSLFVVK